MSFARYSISEALVTNPGLALVTGGRSGIGKAIAKKIATFPFIDHVLVVSRSIQPQDVLEEPKFVAIAADVGTTQGRQVIVDTVQTYFQNNNTDKKIKPLRFLIHSAGSIDPVKPMLHLTQEELRNSFSVNVEGPILLTTALYPFLAAGCHDSMTPGRVLHVSSGAAHGTPHVGWGTYGISKAAFYHASKILDKEFVDCKGGNVRVGSFKPGIVDTNMQSILRKTSKDDFPMVETFQSFKDKQQLQLQSQSPQSSPATTESSSLSSFARPPPKGALDTPDNVAFFVEWLLLGTTNEEFANRDNPNNHGEYDIRDATLFSKWIAPEHLPKE